MTMTITTNSIPEGKYFYWRQNNSGGYYAPPGKHVFVRAHDQDEARSLLEEQPGYTDSFCRCCGERWYEPYELTAEDVRTKLAELVNHTSSAWEHRPDESLPFCAVLGTEGVPGDTETALRKLAKNSNSPARTVLRDKLLEEGREDEMPLLIDQWQNWMRYTMETPGWGRWKQLRLWNGWLLSIQGGASSYCEPRRDSRDAYFYESWELAVFYPNGDWVDADSPNPGLRYLLPAYEQGTMAVCPRVTNEEIKRVMRLLENTDPPLDKLPS